MRDLEEQRYTAAGTRDTSRLPPHLTQMVLTPLLGWLLDVDVPTAAELIAEPADADASNAGAEVQTGVGPGRSSWPATRSSRWLPVAGPLVDLGSAPAANTASPLGHGVADGNADASANLVTSSAKLRPADRRPDDGRRLGLADRPAGSGNHIWVAANKTGSSPSASATSTALRSACRPAAGVGAQ